MQSFIAKPSLDKKLQRAGRICPLPPPPLLVLMRPQNPSKNRVNLIMT